MAAISTLMGVGLDLSLAKDRVRIRNSTEVKRNGK